jgi:spermidine/putrescine ABC transporter ATP-binding subunit
MSTIALEGVSKEFGGVAAVDDVSFELDSGRFLTLLGPSGCGKSTTLRIVSGLAAPDKGIVRIAGKDVTRVPAWERNIGMVFQSLALFPHLTVEQNVAFGLRMRRVDPATKAERVARVLSLVRLDTLGARYPSQLSGGQQQRVALARALVVEPHVLLLDEPFAALDRKLREAMQAELRELTRRIGITAIFVTHDQEEALILSDSIAIMNAGRVEQMGIPAEVFERPRSRFVADFMGATNLLAATVSGRDSDELVLSCGALHLRARDRADVRIEHAVHVAIRPERLRIASVPPGEAVNCASGVVESSVYQGTFTVHRVRLDASAGISFSVCESNRTDGSDMRLGTGTRVWLSWSSEAAQVLPAD